MMTHLMFSFDFQDIAMKHSENLMKGWRYPGPNRTRTQRIFFATQRNGNFLIALNYHSRNPIGTTNKCTAYRGRKTEPTGRYNPRMNGTRDKMTQHRMGVWKLYNPNPMCISLTRLEKREMSKS